MQVLDEMLRIAIPKISSMTTTFFPVFTWRALECFGWDYMRYIGRAPVRYITRMTAPTSLDEVDALIEKHGLLQRELRTATGDDETPAITTLAEDIGHCDQFAEIPALLARALAQGLSLEGVGEGCR